MENYWRMTGIKTFTPPDNDWLTDKLQTFADNSSCRLIRMSGQWLSSRHNLDIRKMAWEWLENGWKMSGFKTAHTFGQEAKGNCPPFCFSCHRQQQEILKLGIIITAAFIMTNWNKCPTTAGLKHILSIYWNFGSRVAQIKFHFLSTELDHNELTNNRFWS